MKEKRDHWKIFGIAMIAVIVVGAAVAGGYLVGSSGDQSTDPSATIEKPTTTTTQPAEATTALEQAPTTSSDVNAENRDAVAEANRQAGQQRERLEAITVAGSMAMEARRADQCEDLVKTALELKKTPDATTDSITNRVLADAILDAYEQVC